MAVNHFQLEALEVVARTGNVTLAAAELRLTQPALTRRIQALESELGGALFHRKSGGLELTEMGIKVLHFAKNVRSMEDGLRSELKTAATAEPAGLIRIGGYSSILNIVMTPALAPLLHRYENVQVRYVATQDIRPNEKQAELLKKSEIDFLVTVMDFADREIVSHRLGALELIAVESKEHRSFRQTYLDTRPDDRTTELFLRQQEGVSKKYQRSFVHDEEGILNAVAEGWGRGIVFSSLAKRNSRVRAVKGMKPMRWPVFFQYRKQPFLPSLFEEAVKTLTESVVLK